jgi:prolyl oligopeptidase
MRLKSCLFVAAAIFGFGAGAVAALAQGADPFAWLEDIHSPRALAWVADENAKTGKVLEADPRFDSFRRQALAIFTAQDRIPMPELKADGLDNLWQDASNPHGLWRHATLESYLSPEPKWTTLIDLDALSKAEGHSWFFKGASCLRPDERFCLVRLSDGGGDAVAVREFDTRTREFVPVRDGGLDLPVAKQEADWIGPHEFIVARDWSGAGKDLTASGYPYVVRTLQGGADITGHGDLFRGEAGDVQVGTEVLRDPDGSVQAVVFNRGVTFFERQFWLQTDGGPKRIAMAGKAELNGLVEGQVVFTVKEDWQGFKAGSVLSFRLDSLKADPASARPTLIFAPNATQAVDAVVATAHRVDIALLENVKGVVESFHYDGRGWSGQRLPLPRDSALAIRAASETSDRLFVTSEGFLDPTALWFADPSQGVLGRAKQLPPRFDASRDVVEQRFATSADGTRVPYFLVRPKDMKLDGSTPVQMFGYGGFEVPEVPIYRPEMGKLWLERGGAYVLADIRGGGEFGPAWHEAALREHRQRAFDDFAAVARDLIATKVTSPEHLGIYGRSNGGVLMSVSMTQHPELYGAVVVESPLVDMLRYTHLSAGASWAAEYGDPDNPTDRAFIAAYSGYQALKPGVKYPEPYITTNTEDDRVHPGHARKFAAKLQSLGDPALYYENTFGGHANDADPELNARRWARHYVYLSQKLMPPGTP